MSTVRDMVHLRTFSGQENALPPSSERGKIKAISDFSSPAPHNLTESIRTIGKLKEQHISQSLHLNC
ncbi:hypothetical protein RB195_007274 [Necator americanus]|uniref:Uncharacterized protein n=1 Tax=Necator americanus TaxID=51031 RepID=A0ABR1BZA2_NECAM